MSYLSMKHLLEAGVHFGHQTRRWNPKMKPYIFGARNGIHIINLQETVKMFRVAYDAVQQVAANGGTVLFVGTKKQAQDSIIEEAKRCGMPYVAYRWLGGMLTNFTTIKKGVERLKKLNSMFEDGSIERFPKKEILLMNKEREKLNLNYGGIQDMADVPDAVFIIDPNEEAICVKEANRLGIPTVAVVDTNCDPDGINYIIPGNDDAIRAIRLLTSRIADAVLEGRQKYLERQQAMTDKSEAAIDETTFAADETGKPEELVAETAGEELVEEASN